MDMGIGFRGTNHLVAQTTSKLRKTTYNCAFDSLWYTHHLEVLWMHHLLLGVVYLQGILTSEVAYLHKMSPETRPCQKEITSSKHHFSGDMLVFRGGINHCQRKILHWIVMSGKICPSLSIHHKVTRINFDRVAKALAVLLGYPGHGNKKTSWISEPGVFFVWGIA